MPDGWEQSWNTEEEEEEEQEQEQCCVKERENGLRPTQGENPLVVKLQQNLFITVWLQMQGSNTLLSRRTMAQAHRSHEGQWHWR